MNRVSTWTFSPAGDGKNGSVCRSNLPRLDAQPEGDEVYLPLDARGLAQEAVEEFEVVAHPPGGGSLDGTRIDVEAAAQALVDGRVALHHLLHEQLLLGRAHGHEHHVGAQPGDVVDEGGPLLLGSQVAVAPARYVDAREVGPQPRHGLLDHLLPSAHEVERLSLRRQGGHYFQPQLAARQLHGSGVSVLAQGHHGARPVAVADVAVDDGARLRRGVQNLFGVDGHEDALAAADVVQQFVERREGVNQHAVEAYSVVLHSLCSFFDETGGIAGPDFAVGNVFGHDGAGTHDGVLADGDGFADHCVASDVGSPFDVDAPAGVAARVRVFEVGEQDAADGDAHAALDDDVFGVVGVEYDALPDECVFSIFNIYPPPICKMQAVYAGSAWAGVAGAGRGVSEAVAVSFIASLGCNG